MKNKIKAKNKNLFKKIGLWSIVFAVLASSVFGAVTYAQEAVTVRNAKNMIEEAATAQVVAQKFSKCLGSIMNSNHNIFPAKDVFSGKVYWGSHWGEMNPTNVATGAWLENKVQGNGGDDGGIHCHQGIWGVFSSTFNVDTLGIVCNKYSDSGNGYLSGGIFKHTGEGDTNCQDQTGYYVLKSTDEANAHIQRIYEDAMKDNPYAKPWGSITYYDNATGYELYRRDLLTKCVSSFNEDASNAGKYNTKAKVVNDKGEINEIYALTKGNMKGSSNAGNTAASRGKLTCDELMGYMNAYAEDYRNAILDAIRKECASDSVIKKVDEYIAKYEEKKAKEGLTDDEQKELDKLNAAKSSGDYTQETDKGGLECAEFKDIKITPEPDSPDPASDPVATGGDEREAKCYSEAKSLGWVICPMIFGMEEVASNIYGQIEPMIRVDKTIVSQMGDTSSSIYQAWGTFRGFANVIFVILFLLIIFSQLTGFGIDNYGIKKMLPKIIMTAILVNLSFWICAIAIDISNIVGSGIRSLLESLKVSSLGTGSVSAFQKGVATVVDFFLVAGTATGVGVLAFALEGWAIVIPILLFLLVAIIAVIFAFIVLGMRQAAVILCVVFAPLAFACSMLPNTEKIFKRWWDIFKGVLLVYPIIGGLIGAGYFASAVILTDEHDFLMTIISCLLCVIPYFMIPSLLKKSLAAAGNIGEKISGFGKGLGNKARNGINGTQAVKNAKADSTAQRAQARAARYMKSDRARQVEEDIKNGRKVSMRRANKYARNASLANANRQSMINARSAQSQYNRLNSDTGFNAAMAAANAAEFDTEVSNYEKLISAGGYRPFDATEPDAKIDQNDNKALQRELEHELSQRGENVNGAKIRALQNQLARNGKEGRTAMFNAMANAQTAAGAAGVDREAVKSFSSNILNNHAGTMKDKHRSLYEFAKNTAVNGVSDDGVNNISQYASRGIGSINASDMTNMDLQQLKRYHQNAKGDDAKVLAQLAQSALTNEHLSQDLSEKTYNELASIARDGGYTPPERLTSKKEGDTGRLHDTTSASTSASPSASAASSASSSSRASTSSAPVRVDQATQSGAQQISATQAAAQVQNAVKQNRSAASTDRKVQSAEADALRIINSGAADAAPINQIISGETGQPIHSEPRAPKDNSSDSSTIIIGNNKPGNPSDIITPGNNKA